MANIPPDLRYTKEHEWAKLEGDKARIGITSFAQEQLGDVVFVELPKLGTKVTAMKTFGVVESVKAVSDLYAPISGDVVEINAELPKKPEVVNADPYGQGWMIVVKLANAKEWDSLMSAADYEKLVAAAGHQDRRYISNTAAQQREMLATIGASSIEELLSRIPTKARLSHPLNVPAAMAEADLVRHLRRLSSKNANADDFACFLGAGSYDHTVPSPINHMISRGEFFTAYTPYQPEASQGTLRSIFEYQTMMAELTGMDVANASLYDGASSLAEAVLMARAVTERNTTVLSKGINPLYRQVVETYVEGPGLRLRSAALGDGVTDLDALRKVVNAQTAAVVIQYPNFFGCLEDVKAAGEIAHAVGALLVVAADPVNLALLAPPGALGADIVVGEGQGLGVPMTFGGPNLGVFAVKQELVRRMPGRLVGATVDL